MEFQFGFNADIGRKKTVNQDKLLVSIVNSPQGTATTLFAIADGMGGTQGGEEASAIAIARLEQWHKNIDIDKLAADRESILNSLRKCFIIVNELIINFGRENNIQSGTTLSVILVIGRDFYVAHTGDSRIYLHRRNRTIQLTQDHSFVAEQVRLGRLTQKEAEKDSRRNVLTQCLGIKEETEVLTKAGKIKNNDMLLLCSDGLYNYIKPETLSKDIWQGARDSAGLQKLADQLVAEANEQGGSDNISIILSRATDKMPWFKRLGRLRKF